jgi:DNA repair protein RecO (recombination protein O)
MAGSESIIVSGMVLSAMPVGENDKRVVLLTRELGRISAFARGARRPGSQLMAVANPFVFGQFTLIPGRSAYSLTRAEVQEYFTEIAAEFPGVYYGYYFLDFAGYYGREGLDATAMLNLLYLTVKALLNPHLDDRLIRRIFELRLMTINGEYAPDTSRMSESALYVVNYIMQAPLTKLYTFSVTDQIREELEKVIDRHIGHVIDRPLKSRKILEDFTK